MTPLPRRLQLSRRKGFDLQALSRSVNGLPAVNCARPWKWGNPYKVGAHDRRSGGILDAETAIERFTNALVLGHLAITEAMIASDLRGKNLACWCAAENPCHCDVLLILANAPICEEVSLNERG